jgi:transposase-like protein
MERRRFTREFKVEAVKLVRERGVSVRQAARDLNVHENVLRKWMKEFGADPQHAFPGHGQMKRGQRMIGAAICPIFTTYIEALPSRSAKFWNTIPVKSRRSSQGAESLKRYQQRTLILLPLRPSTSPPAHGLQGDRRRCVRRARPGA